MPSGYQGGSTDPKEPIEFDFSGLGCNHEVLRPLGRGLRKSKILFTKILNAPIPFEICLHFSSSVLCCFVLKMVQISNHMVQINQTCVTDRKKPIVNFGIVIFC